MERNYKKTDLDKLIEQVEALGVSVYLDNQGVTDEGIIYACTNLKNGSFIIFSKKKDVCQGQEFPSSIFPEGHIIEEEVGMAYIFSDKHLTRVRLGVNGIAKVIWATDELSRFSEYRSGQMVSHEELFEKVLGYVKDHKDKNAMW